MDVASVLSPPRPVRAVDLADALGLTYERVRRWMLRLGRYSYVGSGRRLYLTDADVVAVTVAAATFAEGHYSPASFPVLRRALVAAEAAAAAPDAHTIVASPDWAHAYDTPEGALYGWCAAGRPVAAFVPLRWVLAPVRHLLAEVAA